VHRLAPFLASVQEMIGQGAMSRADLASLARLLLAMIGFDHAADYDKYKHMTASGLCDDLGVSRRAQELCLANFTLASAFSPLDRISASAFMSSAAFYIFDDEASLAARWLRHHPEKLVHAKLREAIVKNGGALCGFTRVLGLEEEGGRVTSVLVDRAHTGLVDVEGVGRTPRDLLHDDPWPGTTPRDLALVRATLRHHAHVWLAIADDGDPAIADLPVAWHGDREVPASLDDPRWLRVEWADADQKKMRILEDEYVTLGTIDARDVPDKGFREILWERTPNQTPREELERLRKNLERSTHLLHMHASGLTTPPHLPLYVGKVGESCRAFAGICTHFGGRLRYDAAIHGFACSLHGSRYGVDGRRRCGPAEADLLSFDVKPSARAGFLDVRVLRPPRIRADHVVVATDVEGLKQIIRGSPSLHDHPSVTALTRMRTTSVTVIRMVIDRKIDDYLVVFVGFKTLDALFNVTKLQGVQLEAYRDRVHEVIELQLYRDRTVGMLGREDLLRTVKAELKEAYGWSDEPGLLEPIHVAVHREVYTSYDPESDSVRPRTESDVEGLYFAGDWVHPDEGAWYMERAVRTGRLAARAVLRAKKEDPERVPLVPPVRSEWLLRRLARAQGALADRALRAVFRILGVNDEPL
jgi:nitrite reductase/ring-hydroxylating ferredoxin subunit